MYSKNQLYADLFYQKINSGSYATARIIESGNQNTVPTTRIISLLNNDQLSVLEASQLIRNIGALVIQLQNQEETQDLTPTQKLDMAMQAFSDQYKQLGGKGRDISQVLKPTRFDLKLKQTVSVAEYKLIREDISKYLKNLSVVTDLRDALDEDEVGQSEFAGYDKEANENNPFASASAWLRQYIALTGKHRAVDGEPQYHSIDVGGTTVKLPIIDVVDPDRVYYGLVRAVSNTTGMNDRLEKLLLYTQFEGTDSTSAFTEQLLKDLAPIRYTALPYLDELLQQYGLTDTYTTPSVLASALHEKHLELTRPQALHLAKQAFQKQQETNPVLIREALLQALNTNQLNDYLSGTGKQVLIKVLKGFDLWTRTMMVQLVDPETGLTQTINANQNRASKRLFDTWKNNYRLGVKAESIPGYVAGEVTQLSLDLYSLAEGVEYFEDLPEQAQLDRINKTLTSQSAEIRREMLRIGVDLSDAYVQYNLIQTSLQYYRNSPVILDRISQTPAYRLTQLFDVPPGAELAAEDLSLAKLYADQDKYSPYSKLSDAQVKALPPGQRELGGMTGRLQRIAAGNSFFDESAYESNYVNAEDKTIYTYQKKTYSLDMFNWFTQSGIPKLKQLYKTGERTLLRQAEDGTKTYVTEDSWTLTQNSLLDKLVNDPFYKANGHLFVAYTVDGVQQTQLERPSQTKTRKDAVAGEGVTFGSMSPREFDLYNLNGLSIHHELTKLVDGKLIAPVFLGNRETSKTGEYMMLPVIQDVFQDNKLTQKGADLLLDEVEKEYNRIGKVYRDLTPQDSDVAPVINPALERYENYNTGKLKQITVNTEPDQPRIWVPTNTKDFQGLQFSDSVAGLLGDTLQALPTQESFNTLITGAILGKPFPREKLIKPLTREVGKIVQQHFDRYSEEGIWDKQKDQPTTLLDNTLTKSAIQNKLVSDVLNGMAMGQIAYGDAALLYKNDGIDLFKRLKGLNAAIVNFNIPFSAPELGIPQTVTHFRTVTTAEPKAVSDVSGEPIDLADAQGYDSVQARRISLYGQGKLTPELAARLDDVQEGKEITGKQLDNLLAGGVLFNSEKTVGATGQYYKKLSMSNLSKQMTADPVDISKELYEQYASLDQYNRTVLKPGSPEVSSYVDDRTGQRVYKLWVAKPHKQQLNDQRLLMDGFQADGEGNWIFRGYQHQIHVITPISASKTLNPNVHQDVKGTDINFKTVQDKSVHLIDLNYYGLQVESGAGHDHIVDPTQMLEIITNELGDGVTIKVGDRVLKPGEIQAKWQELLANRDLINYQIADKSFLDQDGNFSEQSFRQSVFQSALNSNKDKQTIALLSPDSGYNPNLPMTRDQWIGAFFSHFSKGVLSHKRSGDALAHVSSMGHQGIKRVFRNALGYLTWEYIRENSPEYSQLRESGNLYSLPSLAKYRYKHEFVTNPDGSKTRTEPQQYTTQDKNGQDVVTDSWFKMAGQLLGDQESMYIMDSLRHAKPRYELVEKQLTETGYFSEELKPVYDTRITDITPSLRYSFNVRIPSQDKHSAIGTEWVDTLPAHMGNSVITAKEVVELSGSDFDIDKLYQTRPEGYWTKKDEFIQYGTAITPAEKWEEYERYIMDKKNYPAITRAIKEQVVTDPQYKDFRDALDLFNTDSENDYTPGLSKNSLGMYLLLDKAAITAGQKERYNQLVKSVFTRFGLPATEQELESRKEEQLHVGVIHNQMLQMQQGLLYNSSTLDDNDPNGGQANQPAALTKLTELKEAEEGGVQLFGDNKTKISSHWPLVHSRVHEKNQVGKANIGVGVNANLFIINAVKLGFQVNDLFMPRLDDGLQHTGTYKDQLTDKEGNPVLDAFGKPIRVFDVNSTIITADTDEAKEGLNAFFNMSVDAQGVVMHLNGLGYSLLDALTLVNQQVVQEYIKETEKLKNVKAGRGIISPQEKAALAFATKGVIYGTVLAKYQDPELGKDLESYSTEQLRQNLAAAKSGKEQPHVIHREVLQDFVNMLEVNEFAGNYVRFIKLKKGFGQDLESFELLKEAAVNLGFGSAGLQELDPINIKERMLASPKESKQILQLISKILPRNEQRQTELFVRKTPGYLNIKQKLQETLKVIGAKQTQILNQAVESFMFTKLYLELFKPGSTLEGQPKPSLNQVYTDGGEELLANQLQEFKKKWAYTLPDSDGGIGQQGPFANNPIFSLLLPEEKNGVSTVKLNTIVKLRPEQQEALLDSFRSLYTQPNQPLENGVRVGEAMANQLVNYFIAKDGWQFAMGSISKLFSPESFGQISQQLDDFQRAENIDSKQWAAELLTSLGRDVNYQEFLPGIKIPGKKSEVYALVQQSGIVQHQNLDGKPTTQQQSPQLIITKPNLTNKDEFFKVVKAIQFNLNEDQDLIYPRFIKLEKTIYGDKTAGEEDTKKTVSYELVSVADINGNVKSLDRLKGETTVAGHQARYVEVIPSGSRGISAATGLGQHYTQQQLDILQARIDGSTGAAQNYYQNLLANRVVPGIATQTLDFNPFDSIPDMENMPEYMLDNQAANSYISSMTTTEISDINIYSTLKNGYQKLSNLLNGPVTETVDGKSVTFKTVEHAYQTKKALFAGDRASANAIVTSNNGWDAQRLGRAITGLDDKKWDTISVQELEKSMVLAFQQNESVRDLLLSTGTTNLVHKSDRNLGKWATEFPKILMQIRSSYQSITPTATVNLSATGTDLAASVTASDTNNVFNTQQTPADFKLNQPCA